MPHTFPDGLATVPTGPQLVALLASVDVVAAPDERLLDVLAAQWRQLSYQQAQVWAVMAELAQRDPAPNLPGSLSWTREQIFESAVDEVRAELRLTRRTARAEVEQADAVMAMPRVAQALKSGAIDRRRAGVLADGCIDLTSAQTETLLDAVLPDAATVTATGLAERVRRIAIALDPAWAERRYCEAVRERRVVGYLNDDGSATVSGQNLPAAQAATACSRVNALGDAAKRAGAGVGIDHLRAELFLGLLDGRFDGMAEKEIVAALLTQFPTQNSESPLVEEFEPDAVDPVPTDRDASGLRGSDTGRAVQHGVELRVGLGTLLGSDEQPGEIAGWGPVTATVARRIAMRQRRAEWRFAVVDEDGQPVFDGVTRRRPNGATGAQPEVRGALVELHVPLALLTDSDAARRHPAWTAVLADLSAQYATRRQIDQDPAARFAGRPLRRRAQITMRHCIFPGCRRPASDCDLDHRHDHSRGGRTEEENLAPSCRHDHMNKTKRGWRLARRNQHMFVWISPLGRRHVVHTQPVAPPLPEPIPRREPVHDCDPPPF